MCYKIRAVNRFEDRIRRRIVMTVKEREQEVIMGFLFGEIRKIKNTGYVAYNRKPTRY